MSRKPTPRWMRLAVATASWVVTASVAQAALGTDIGSMGRKLEEQIELQLKGGPGESPIRTQPEHTHEESIEPWELVSV